MTLLIAPLFTAGIMIGGMQPASGGGDPTCDIVEGEEVNLVLAPGETSEPIEKKIICSFPIFGVNPSIIQCEPDADLILEISSSGFDTFMLTSLEKITLNSDPGETVHCAITFDMDGESSSFEVTQLVWINPPEPPFETEKFYTDTNVDIEAGILGELLPFKNAIVDTENPTQTVQAVIHPKTGKINSYNPGQYYAVTKVTANEDLDRLWIFEDDLDCTDGISKWNPAKVPGGAYVALMCDGVTVDLTSELANADPPQLFRNEATGLLEAHVEGVPAGCMVFLGVKYSPGLKGETFGGLGPQDLFCENREFVCLSQEGFPTTPNEDFPEACKSASFRDSAQRVLEVVMCGENEAVNPINGKCICPEGFEETPSGICVAGET